MCATAVWILLVLVFFAGLAYLGRNNMFCPPCRPLQLLHNLRSPPKTTAFQVKESDSVDERLDRLAEALADKESHCYLSKFKILSTKHEMSQLGDGSKQQYRSILEGLRKELSAAEVECRRIQQLIEWVSQRRAELNDEIQLGHRMYGRAATELASNLTDLQQGRSLCRPAPYQVQTAVGCRCKE
ncbi:uncharacterized protein LOC121737668 isoform X2 [Aricia agestis]|uniref:uncharacterized protein LOC121737668 isoform X2 n=1 Tax=Aricia agestis TaxID=91739 RepID=UPI001C20B150|nr:uncharacterized protein LOC121737668 isoform X2 [Aricia agestis]